jgi:hypothetical protein
MQYNILKTLFFIILLSTPLHNIHAYPLTALSWSNFSLDTSVGSYDQTHALIGPYTPTIRLRVDAATPLALVEPVALGQTVEPGFLTNPTPVLGIGTKNAVGSTTSYTMQFDSIGANPILRPGDAFYVNELLSKSTGFTNITAFKACSDIACATILNTSLSPTNADIDGLTLDATYTPIAGTIAPSGGGSIPTNTGALFLLNTGGVGITRIEFTVNPETLPLNGDLVVFGVAAGSGITPVPEPSTYVILGSMLLFSIVMLRKKRKCSQ